MQSQARSGSRGGSRSSLRIGLLGGSFDPIHLAHVALAQCALAKLELDQVQLLPAKQPWQKPDLAASTEQRLAMIKLAISDIPGLDVNEVELTRPGKTYTIDTLEALAPEHQYFWLLGADQLQNFPTWHRWQDVAKRVTLVAAQRPGAALSIGPELTDLVKRGQTKVIHLDFEPMDVSSSALREALRAQQPTGQWLDPRVASYIQEHGLYQAKPSAAPNSASTLE